jgi:enamine deaminase RidA (YjgF/YER057c/UK114 family)
MTISDDVEEQTRQTLRNIGAALADAGASFTDVVRVHYLMPDLGDFEKTWPALQEVFGEVRPAATAFQAGLSNPEMKIEIEVTAHLHQA